MTERMWGLNEFRIISVMDGSSEDGFTNWGERIQKEEEEKREEGEERV